MPRHTSPPEDGAISLQDLENALHEEELCEKGHEDNLPS